MVKVFTAVLVVYCMDFLSLKIPLGPLYLKQRGELIICRIKNKSIQSARILSSCPNCPPPPPHLQAIVAPPLGVGGDTPDCGRGLVGGPIPMKRLRRQAIAMTSTFFNGCQ